MKFALTKVVAGAMGIYSVAVCVLYFNMYRINMWAAHFDMVNHTERGLHIYNYCKLMVAQWPMNILLLLVMLVCEYVLEKKENKIRER